MLTSSRSIHRVVPYPTVCQLTERCIGIQRFCIEPRGATRSLLCESLYIMLNKALISFIFLIIVGILYYYYSKQKEYFENQNELCIRGVNDTTCLTSSELLKLKGLVNNNLPATSIRATSVKFEAPNNTWSIQPESGIAFVIRDNVSGGDKRHAFFKNRYVDM